MNKAIFILLFGFSHQLFGDGNTLYEETTFNKPDIGNETEVYLGDRMLIQQTGEWRECITPTKTHSKSSMGWTYL